VALGSDPYTVLGVSRDATESQIAQARRQLSREYHPDVNSAPDAAARFDEVQQAFSLLSDPAARAEYDRVSGRPGAVRAARDPGSATEAAPGIFVQPTSVDFGLLEPRRPYADAKVSIAWTGALPGRVTSEAGGGWWTNLGAEMPASSCIVFYLRAAAHAEVPNGRQRAQFTVTLDGTPLTVQLTAEVRGAFPPASPPAFHTAKRTSLEPRQLWIGVLLIVCVFLLVYGYLH
jgi:hypothetical protein